MRYLISKKGRKDLAESRSRKSVGSERSTLERGVISDSDKRARRRRLSLVGPGPFQVGVGVGAGTVAGAGRGEMCGWSFEGDTLSDVCDDDNIVVVPIPIPFPLFSHGKNEMKMKDVRNDE